MSKFLNDSFELTLLPLLRLKPLFLYADGILNPWQRLFRQKLNREKITIQSDRISDLQKLMKLMSETAKIVSSEVDFTASNALVRPVDWLNNFSDQVSADLSLVKSKYKNPIIRAKFGIEGKARNIFIHPTAQIASRAVIDAQNGPVVIGAHVRIGAFSIVRGPAVISDYCQLDRCSFSASRAGVHCRLGGEIDASFIGNYSNKHHEGFLGHSLVGDWVNLGALTTTSDLKNNYSDVRLKYNEKIFSTGTIKFGSIIGDYVKTAIGTLLSTGTIVDFGSSLHGEPRVSGYVAPFTWGGTTQRGDSMRGSESVYDVEKFLQDANKMMQRRDCLLNAEQEAMIRRLTSL